jgi:hypothetical protein
MERQASRRFAIDLAYGGVAARRRERRRQSAQSGADDHQTTGCAAMESRGAFPPESVESCPLIGRTTEPSLYCTLIRWHPGYMSAPHFYSTDRYCMVLSGTWWCNSGADFDPASCVPVQAGSYVRRVALTPHYDGVIRGHNEPAVIAICGIGPINFKLSDPTKPAWREV